MAKMQSEVGIHVYGECGAPCPGDANNRTACIEHLNSHYKYANQ